MYYVPAFKQVLHVTALIVAASHLECPQPHLAINALGAVASNKHVQHSDMLT